MQVLYAQAQQETHGYPLHAACEYNDTDDVRTQLDNGADPNWRVSASGCANGETPLFVASSRGHIGIVAMLVEAGAVVNQARADGMAPLHMAAATGFPDVVSYLLQRHANAALSTPKGDTALTLAIAKGHTKCVELLRAAGPSLDASQQSMLKGMRVDGNLMHFSLKDMYPMKDMVELMRTHIRTGKEGGDTTPGEVLCSSCRRLSVPRPPSGTTVARKASLRRCLTAWGAA